MFDWLRKLGGDGSGHSAIVGEFRQMLVDGRHGLDLATDALLCRASAEDVRSELFATDRKINQTEQKLRRDLIVHASVHGATEFPSCLVLMSIGKDAERIGDYCKNIFDLAVRAPLASASEYHDGVAALSKEVLDLLDETVTAYDSQNEKVARGLIRQADGIQDECDRRVDELIAGDVQAGRTVVAALAYRYLKRITGHAMNVVTSIVMPIDKLDFFDER